MSGEDALRARWDKAAREVVECPDCTSESHVRSIRYLLAEAYEDGRRDGRSSQWGLS